DLTDKPDQRVLPGGAASPGPALVTPAPASLQGANRQPIPLRREPRPVSLNNLCSCSSILFDDCMESF
ncbi:MAG TPA: hypothetical protein PKO06_24885, partial [Candidatus Ozemobacteraceae bacterium]|nr:hypothetical protein [Candidatus Ozemobacteraceae bacterium]